MGRTGTVGSLTRRDDGDLPRRTGAVSRLTETPYTCTSTASPMFGPSFRVRLACWSTGVTDGDMGVYYVAWSEEGYDYSIALGAKRQS